MSRRMDSMACATGAAKPCIGRQPKDPWPDAAPYRPPARSTKSRDSFLFPPDILQFFS